MALTTAQLNKAVAGTTLILRNLQLSTEDIQLLCEFLSAHQHITTIDLLNNYISAEGAKALAATTLTTLDVSANRIDVEGAKALIANYNLHAIAEDKLSTAYKQALAEKKPLVKANFLRTTAKMNSEVPSLFMFCLFKVNNNRVIKEDMEKLPFELKEKVRPPQTRW